MRQIHLASAFLLLATSLGTVAACSETTEDAGSGGGGASSGGSSSGGNSNATGGASEGGGGSGGETAVADSWLGAEAHLDLDGHVDTQSVRLISSGDDAADLGTLYCERNYIVPDVDDETNWGTEGYLEKVEFKFNFVYDGEFAEFQLELAKEDLPSYVGQTLTVGEDIDVAVGLKVNPDEPNEVEYEDEATSGLVELELLSGEVGADGLTIASGTGALGAYVELTLASGKTFVGSFTANCGDNDFETPAE